MSTIRLHPLAFLAAAAVSMPVSSPAYAIPGSPFDLYVRLGWAHDDNLLRVADNAPAFDNQRSDSWTTAEVGAVYDKSYRRQRVRAVAKLSKVTFNHFEQLDYDGKDAEATWFWELGNRFYGKLGATYVQTLAPYTDFRSNQRNLRDQRRGFFEGAWKLHPRWEAHTALSRERFDYDLALQSFNDRTVDVFEIEGRYLARSGSTVGLVLRRIEGDYPNQRPFAQTPLTDDFTQDELKARVDWKPGGAMSVQALAGYARRSQPSFGSDRTSGVNGRVTVSYEPNGKLAYRTSIWRDFAPIESPLVSYTLNKGISLGSTWNASAKIRVDADAIYERRNYTARAGFAAPADLEDTLRSVSVKANWTIRPGIALSAAFVHEERSGSPVLGIGDFKANTFAINASAQF